MTAEAFVNLLEQRSLVPARVLRKLRENLSRRGDRLNEAKIADALVEAGHLSRYQADRLLAEMGSQAAAEILPEATKDLPDFSAQDNIGFALLDDEPPPKSAPPLRKQGEVPSPDLSASRHSPLRTAWKVGESPMVVDPTLSLGSRPPLEELDADLGSEAFTDSPLIPARGKSPWFARRLRRRSKRGWDSPLLLWGGGLLLTLLLLTAGLLWSIRRENAGEIIRRADEDYAAQSYGQAIHKYTLFLRKFPGHDQTSYARVRLALARLRQSVEGSSNWTAALNVAREEVPQIAGEREFGSARDELAALLPRIAEGLSESGLKAAANIIAESTPQEVRASLQAAQTAAGALGEALGLVRRYVREDLRNEARLRDISGALATLERGLARGDRLTGTLMEMRAALERGEPEAVHALRSQLLADFPELAANVALRDMARAAAERLPSRVTRAPAPSPVPPQPLPSRARAVVPYRNGLSAARGPSGESAAVVVGGAVYCLDPVAENLMWRRYVGRDVVEAPPVVSDAAGRAFLLVDSLTWEVMRVNAADGAIAWRLPVGEPFTVGIVDGGRLALVAAAAGSVVTMDTSSGTVAAALRFPEPLSTSAAAAGSHHGAYVAGEHSHLFVISADGTACKQAVYLGHEPATVVVPPAVMPRYVVVAENHRLDAARLRVLRIRPEDASLQEVQSLPVQGNVTTPMTVQGRRLAAVTDLGAIYIFEEDAGPRPEGLRQVVHRPATERSPADHFILMLGTTLYVASHQLVQYEIQPSRARLDSRMVVGGGDPFLAAPLLVRERLLSVRREHNRPGVVVDIRPVAAANGGGHEVLLGVPLAGTLQPWDQGVLGVTQRGDLVYVSSDAAPVAQVIRPVSDGSEEILAAWNLLVHRDPAQMVWSTSDAPDRIYTVRWAAGDARNARASWMKLPARRRVASAPAWFAGGMLYGDVAGPVHWIDHATASPRAEPFLPVLSPGQEVNWLPPAISPDGASAVVSDGDLRLFRLEVEKSPVPSLVAKAQRELTSPPAAPPVILGATVFVLQEGGQLVRMHLNDLATRDTFSIAGEPALLPCVVGDRVFIETMGNLYCFDEDAGQRWSIPLTHGPLAGPPAGVEGGFVYATQGGDIVRVAAVDGRESGVLTLKVPLATGPLVSGGVVYAGGHDGTIYEIPLPP